MTCYATVAEIKRANRAAGRHFFDAAAMRFFRSRVSGPVIGCRYFVTSERFSDDTPRGYTVRSVDDAGNIDTVHPDVQVDGFMYYPSRRAALAAARALDA